MPQDEDEDDEEDVVLLRECLQRQLDELEAIELIYPPSSSPSSSSTPTIAIDPAPRGTIMLALAKSSSSLSSLTLPRLSLAVGTSPCIGIGLPPYYPETLPTLRWKEGGGRTTQVKQKAMQKNENISTSYDGTERLLPLIQEFYAWLEEEEEAAAAARQKTKQQQEEESALPPELPVLGRRLIYFHHIINKNKREFVIKEALAHGLGGYSKFGWPGVVVVEGEEGQVAAYVRLLQTLRWKEIRVRGEERVVCREGEGMDDLRRLHRGFEELEARELSVLARHMREAGLEELFGTLMK